SWSASFAGVSAFGGSSASPTDAHDVTTAQRKKDVLFKEKSARRLDAPPSAWSLLPSGRSMQRPRVANAARALSLSGVVLGGCDIVQGFQNASEAVFPIEKTYLDPPGYRIASGGFRALEFAGGTDLYLVARSSDPADASLYAMLYGDPLLCTI